MGDWSVAEELSVVRVVKSSAAERREMPVRRRGALLEVLKQLAQFILDELAGAYL